jgi:transposase
MQPIPVPIRQRIMTLYRQGKSTRQISALFGYSVASIRRVRQHLKERRTLFPVPIAAAEPAISRGNAKTGSKHSWHKSPTPL